MMTEPVVLLYREAKRNMVFRQELKDVGEKMWKPSIFWDNQTKCIYAMCYMGWLIARGEYMESNYKD